MSTPHRAPAWHRECNSCGIVLTVRIEDDSGETVMRPAPSDKPCDLCKDTHPGPWVEGEYDPIDDEDEDDGPHDESDWMY